MVDLDTVAGKLDTCVPTMPHGYCGRGGSSTRRMPGPTRAAGSAPGSGVGQRPVVVAGAGRRRPTEEAS